MADDRRKIRLLTTIVSFVMVLIGLAAAFGQFTKSAVVAPIRKS